MKKVEQEILHRMHCLLTAIPLPAGFKGGSQSASILPCVEFSKDMAEMLPQLDQAWSYFKFGDYEEAKTLLSAIEAWIEMREEQGWQSVFNNKTIRQFEKEIEQRTGTESGEGL